MTTVRQWVALTVAAVTAVLALGWVLLVSPQRTQADELRTTEQEQRQNIARTVTQLAVLKAQAREVPAQQQRLDEIGTKIPGDTALPALVRALRDASAASGVEFLSLVPGTPAPAAGSASSGAGLAATASLHVQPVTINVVGGYYDIEHYLGELEGLSRALRVVSLAVSPGDNPLAVATTGAGPAGSSALDGSQLTAAISAEVYLASTPGSLPALQGAAGGPAPAGAPTATTPGVGSTAPSSSIPPAADPSVTPESAR